MSDLTRQQLPSQMLKPKDAAALLGLRTQELYKRVQANAIPAHRMGRILRFDLGDLIAYRKAGMPKPVKRTPENRLIGLQNDMMKLLIEQTPGIQTKRWRQTVVQAFAGADCLDGDEDDFHDAVYSLRQLPDAFVVNRDQQFVHFFEVEITSPMSRAKLHSYAQMVAVFDYYHIEFAVFSVNQYGHINLVDLLPYYAQWLKSQQEKQEASA